MLSRLSIARIIVTIPAVFVALVPPLADLNETHVFHHHWTGHARFHTVWLLATMTLVNLLALVALWGLRAVPERLAIQCASALTGATLLGFFVAALTMPLYGGALADAGGVPAAAGLDANLVAFSVNALLLALGLWFARSSR